MAPGFGMREGSGLTEAAPVRAVATSETHVARPDRAMWVAVAGLLMLSVAGWAWWPSLMDSLWPPTDGSEQARGSFGDRFGALNALSTTLVFVLLLATLWMQRKELALQRAELALTREELAGQKAQLERQATKMEEQRRDAFFFQLMSMQAHVVGGVSFGNLQADRAVQEVF